MMMIMMIVLLVCGVVVLLAVVLNVPRKLPCRWPTSFLDVTVG